MNTKALALALALLSFSSFASTSILGQESLDLANALSDPNIKKCLTETMKENRIFEFHLTSGQVETVDYRREYTLQYSAGATLANKDPNEIGEEIVDLDVTVKVKQGYGGIVRFHCDKVTVTRN